MAHGRPTLPFDGDGLRRRRELGGMSLRALAERCEQRGQPISNSQLSKIERGLSRPRPALLKVLAGVFKVRPEQLLATDTAAA